MRRRSNFHNPAKSAASFWALQSDYELQTMDPAAVRTACQSADSRILVTGCIRDFPDSMACTTLSSSGIVSLDAEVDFLLDLKFHGVRIRKGEHLLMGRREVYLVERILRVGTTHYLLLGLIAPMFSVDEFDQMVVESATPQSFRLISLSNATDLTALWTCPVGPVHTLPPKLRLQPKW